MSQSVETVATQTPAASAPRADSSANESSRPISPAISTPPRARLLPWVSTWILLASLAAIISTALVVAVHGTQGFFLQALATLVCMLAALFDGYTSRIPNFLTYPAILAGLLLNSLAPLLEFLHAHPAAVWLGAPGPVSSLAGFGACALLGLIGCLMAGVHGGDLKLLAAVGALLGLVPTANILIVALVVALAYALLNLALLGGLNKVVGLATMRLLEAIYLRRFETPLPEEDNKASHIPMAVPLALGLIVAQAWHIRTGGSIL